MRKRYKRIAVIVSSLALLIFVAQRALFFVPGALEHYSSYLVYPVLVMQHKVVSPLKDYFANRKTISLLQEQLVQAQAERDNVLAQNIELHGMISFAQDTHELVQFKQRYNFSQALLAQVLVKNFSEQSHFFLIDKGSAAGAQKDMVVIYKDCLIGRVCEVYPYYSKVVLVSDQSCKVAAYCAHSKATGIFQGSNAEWAACLNHVSHLSSLEIGELIVSSGDGLIFPRGFGLGKIKSYQTEGLFHSVSIEPLVDLHAINHCYVVQKGECVQEAITL